MGLSFPLHSSSFSLFCLPLCSGLTGAMARGCCISTSPNGRSAGTHQCTWRRRSRRRGGWRGRGLTGRDRGWELDAGRRGRVGQTEKCPFWCLVLSTKLASSITQCRRREEEPHRSALLMLSDRWCTRPRFISLCRGCDAVWWWTKTKTSTCFWGENFMLVSNTSAVSHFEGKKTNMWQQKRAFCASLCLPFHNLAWSRACVFLTERHPKLSDSCDIQTNRT